ncbi:ABC transporter ATP-binding protein [Phormidium tenue FACHB-886]|nr:ABC transporter ATP-binding protein [Phormidium tenue FACHB-886]
MLDVESLSVNYRGRSALEEVSLTIAPGELIGLIGPNGAGKSTFIKALLGLVPTQTGQVLFQGVPLRRQRQRIAYVPQRSQIDWDYPVTAWNVVMMAQTPQAGWLRFPNRQARRTVWQALERVEMLDLRDRQIGELSGGQQQRIFLARALAQQADLFLLDEPFTGIDKKTEAIMLGIFAELRQAGKTLLVCSHDWGEVLNRYDRLLLLNRRLIANDTPQAVMTLANIQRAYGENLQLLSDRTELPFFC